jgi:hypothetical protein
MMPDFSAHQLDLVRGRAQVEEPRALLHDNADLGEAALAAYFLHDMEDSAEMQARLGDHRVQYTGVSIVGRDHHREGGEPARPKWRRKHTVVNSKQIVCMTYDQRLDDLSFRLDTYESADGAGG